MSGLLSGKDFVCVCVHVYIPISFFRKPSIASPASSSPQDYDSPMSFYTFKTQVKFFLLTSFNIIMLSLSQRKKKPLEKLPQLHFLICKVIYLFAYQFSCLLRIVFILSDFSICSKPYHHGIISESTCQHLSRNLFLYLPDCISWQNVFLIMFLRLLNID